MNLASRLQYGVLLLFLLPVQVMANEQAPRPTHTAWHALPLPEGRGGVGDIAVDQNGVLWGLVRGGVYYWDGERFVAPRGDELTSGYYLSKLIGGNDRALYVSQTDERLQTGRLYRLQDGSCEYITDFRYDVGHELPGLYVCRSGHIYNWGETFLSVFVDGEWQNHACGVGLRGVQAIEVGGRVCILGKHPEKLFVFDRRGAMSKHDLKFGESVPLGTSPRILPWGQHRILALSEDVTRILAYDLASGEPVDTEAWQRQWQEGGYFGVFGQAHGFARRDGSVWLLTSADGIFSFDRLLPNGVVQRMPATASRGWGRAEFRQFPDTVLETSDGAMWLALADTSVVQFEGGRLRRFGWRDGVSLGRILRLREGVDGTLYAASVHGIAAWRPVAQRPLPEWTGVWHEYQLAAATSIRDSDGNVWMLLRDRPEEVSRWDGTTWDHHPLPIDRSKIYRGMADDQGHIFLIGSPACYDVSPHGFAKFEDAKAAVVAAIGRRVQRLNSFGDVQCIVDGQQAWLGFDNRDEVQHFDGERWKSLRVPNNFGYLFESSKYGVLIGSQGGKFYRYDGRQLRYATDRSSHSRWLWSQPLMQPYESTLLDRRPGDYAIVQQGHLAIRQPVRGIDGHVKTSYLMGDPLPHGISWRSLTRAWRDGHWTDYGAAPIYRLLGNRIVKCDWRQSPLRGREHEIRQVIEDRAGNLWIVVGKQVFMKRISDFIMQIGDVLKTDNSQFQIDVVPRDSWHGDYQPRIFWRAVDEAERNETGKNAASRNAASQNAAWQGGDSVSRLTLPIDDSEEVEIMGMDRHGGTTRPLRQSLH